MLGEKVYDGTTDVPVTNIIWGGLVGDHTLRQTTDYTMEAVYDGTDAGERTITVTMKLLDTPTASYYRFATGEQTSFTISGTIKPRELTPDMFQSIGEQTYTGESIKPDVQVAAGERTLTADDYTVSYGDNISDIGTVTITGKRNYTGKVTLEFPISGSAEKTTLSAAAYKDEVQTNSFTYGDRITIKGSAMEGTEPISGKVALYIGDAKLSDAVDVKSDGSYEITYDTVGKGIPASGANTALVLRLTDGGSEDAQATATVSVILAPMQVSAGLTGNAEKTYDGTTDLPQDHTVKVELEGVLKADETTLSADASYQFNSASAGTKTVTASDVTLVSTGVTPDVAGFYQLKNADNLSIQVAGGITPATLTPDITAQNKDYDGTTDASVTVSFKGLVGGEQLTEDEDYTLSAAFDDEKAGTGKTVTATITLTGEGVSANYRFADGNGKETTVTAQADVAPITLTKEMFAQISDQAWTGNQIAPKISIAEGQTLLTEDDFTVTYGTNIEGKGSAFITGENNFTGKVTLEFNIIGGPREPEISAAAYKGDTAATAFTYGDTITIKGAAVLNHDATAGTVSLYVDGRQIGNSVDVNSNGTYTITYDTTGKAVPASGEPIVLELRLDDDTEKNAASAEASVTLSPKEVTVSLFGNAEKTYDGTDVVPSGHSLELSLEGVLGADSSAVGVTADYRFADVKAGTNKVIADNAVLSDTSEGSGVTGFYRLAAQEEVSAQVSGGITPAVLTVTAEAKDKVYNGNADAEAVVTFAGLQNSETLTLGTDYSVSARFEDRNAENDKEVTVEVTLSDSEAASNYTFNGTGTAGKTASCTTKAAITALTLTNEMFASIPDQTYTASPITPEVTLADAYKTLLSTDDYEVKYSDNTAAGTAKATVTGKNNAEGSVELTFEINGLQTQLSAQTQDGEGNPKTQFTYGDTIRIAGSLETEAADAYILQNNESRTGQGQVALYVGNMQVAEPQSVSLGSNTFAFVIDTANKTIPAGDVAFKLQYTGDASLGASQTELSIQLDKVLLTPQVSASAPVTKTYDGTVEVPADQTPQITLSGAVVNGDEPVLAAPVWTYAAAGASDSVDVIGTGLALDGSWSSWYTLSTDTVTLSGGGRIEKATTTPGEETMALPVGVADAFITKDLSGLVPDNAGGTPVYEVVDYSTTGLASAAINEQGELSLVAKTQTDTDMTDTVTVKVSGMANYNDFTIKVAVSYVEQTPISIILTPSPTSLIYTAQQIPGYGGLEASYTDAGGITHSFDVAALSYVYQGTTREGEVYGPVSTPPTQAGSYTVTVSVPETETLFTGSASLSFTIEPASLVIKADNVEIVQGQPLPTLTYTVEGLMGEDSLLTEPVLTPSAIDTSLPGTYAIGISGASASANYIITGYVPAVLTITEAPAPSPDPQVPTTEGSVPQNVAIPPKTGDEYGLESGIYAFAGALAMCVFVGLYKKRKHIHGKR